MRLFIIVDPNLRELFDCTLFDRQIGNITLAKEGFKEACNEKIEKDLRYDDLESQMKDNTDR